MARSKSALPPLVVVFGEEETRKLAALRAALAAVLPPEVDRSMALAEYDGTRTPEQGGPGLAAVMDDLATLPFLADRRVVVVTDADKFVSAHREALEKYLAHPHAHAVLVLVCRSFPRTTRLYKAGAAAGAQFEECKKLSTRELTAHLIEHARTQRKRLDPAVAARLIDRIGPDQGALEGEIEKLSLYVGDRPAITDADVSELVGLSREERVFAVMDAAAAGDLPAALARWRQVLATDPAAVYRAVGGIAFVLRRWLAAHGMHAQRMPVRAIAPKVMMWGRERELETLLRRTTPGALQRALAALASLDAKAKLGLRSIETGVEGLLIDLARSSA